MFPLLLSNKNPNFLLCAFKGSGTYFAWELKKHLDTIIELLQTLEISKSLDLSENVLKKVMKFSVRSLIFSRSIIHCIFWHH